MISEKVFFDNKQGLKLAAYLDKPDKTEIRYYAVFAHCFTCSKNLKAVNNISRTLTKNNVAVLRFDFSGIGESEGVFEETNFSTNISDIVSASEFLDSNYEAPKLLIGHSLGGTAALAAKTQINSVQGLVTIASPCEAWHILSHFDHLLNKIEQSGTAQIIIGGMKFLISQQLVDDLKSYDLKDTPQSLDCPLLILHSPVDKTVDIKAAEKLFERADTRKSFISLEKMSHLMEKEGDAQYVGNVISIWANRHILD